VGFVHNRIDELESTNKSLWEYASRKTLPDFYTVSTSFQLKGTGQGENFWESEKNQNILMSTIINPNKLLAENAFQISRWASVSIINYLESKGINGLTIKWPNDIYVGNQKIAGILIQNAISGQLLNKSMIGIGLNINQLAFTSNAPNPVSLAQLTSTSYNVLQEINKLINHLQKYYQWITETPQLLIDTYHNLLYQKDEWHMYESQGKQFSGRIKGVDQFGQLIIENKQKRVDVYDVKDIQFLR